MDAVQMFMNVVQKWRRFNTAGLSICRDQASRRRQDSLRRLTGATFITQLRCPRGECYQLSCSIFYYT